MVQTRPHNFQGRLVIRKYFGNDCLVSDSCDIVFGVGRSRDSEVQISLNQEQDTYGDILQEDFEDSYNNLTLKTLFSLKYFNGLPGRYTHLMKVDDDCYFNVPRLLDLIKTQNDKEPMKSLLMGLFRQRNAPLRNMGLIGSSAGKWVVPMYMYDKNVLPDYFAGPGYLMNRNAMECIMKFSRQEPILFLEDVYITGVCTSHCTDIKRIGTSSFRVGGPMGMNQFKPDFDAMIHKVDVPRIHHWYKLTLEMKKKGIDSDQSHNRCYRSEVESAWLWWPINYTKKYCPKKCVTFSN